MMRPSCSMQAQLRPISPRPPRKVILTRPLEPAVSTMKCGVDLSGSILEACRCRTHGKSAFADRDSEGAHHGLGREGVGGGGAGLEQEGLEQAAVDLSGVGRVALGGGG